MERRAVRPRGSSDPYGLLPPGSPIAPLLASAGLVVAAIATIALLTGWLPFAPGSGGNVNGGGGDANRTPVPSNVVVPNPQVSILGSLVYEKAGNLWVQSGTDPKQITTGGHDSMPTWSPDGQWIYFIETRTQYSYFPISGAATNYTLHYPVLSRVRPDGSGRQALLSGLFTTNGGKYAWFKWYRQPAVSPDGKTVALISDAPNPTLGSQDIVLQLYNLATGVLTNPQLPDQPPLGHQDPAWRPDGKVVAYVVNGRTGTVGTPRIYLYNVSTKKNTPLSGPGYLGPSWSPDGRYIAATYTTPTGSDVVILDATTGKPVIQVTDDHRSWGATWSPAGNEIAYMNLSGSTTDLKLVKLSGTAPSWTIAADTGVTQYSGLDGSSPASWYVPPALLPTPTPSLTPSPSGSGAKASGSTASGSTAP